MCQILQSLGVQDDRSEWHTLCSKHGAKKSKRILESLPRLVLIFVVLHRWAHPSGTRTRSATQSMYVLDSTCLLLPGSAHAFFRRRLESPSYWSDGNITPV